MTLTLHLNRYPSTPFPTGTNVVGKAAFEALTDGQIQILQKWGLNVVRLGLSWDLYETAPGVFDNDYMEKTKDIVSRLAKVGIYSFIDMHQDVYSKLYCGGHGIPEWEFTPANETEFYKGGKKTFPHPLVKIDDIDYREDDEYSGPFGVAGPNACAKAQSTPLGWAGVYFTNALSSSTQLLYDNYDGRLDRFGEFWKRVATEFKDEEFVLGYELINEPWVGDTFNKPSLLVPSRADKINLAPFYDKLNEAIRSVDDETLVFYEPATGGNIQDTFAYGGSSGPGGEEYNDRNVLSYHVYCPPMQTDIGTAKGSDAILKLCEGLNGWQIGVRGKDTVRLKSAGFLSEFGAIDPTNANALKLMDLTMSKADEFLHSWSYWYVHVAEDGSNPEAKSLARTYARRTAGQITNMKFDAETAEFELEYVGCRVGGETEIYLSKEFHYPKGITSVCDGGVECMYDGENTLIVKQSGVVGVKITVKVSAVL